jgi:alkanesulfonate monooxygenase SsuD/methylene tetrahydromethanopterin reductase-like flavin-dependent oxidoreductase (luciferase family)
LRRSGKFVDSAKFGLQRYVYVTDSRAEALQAAEQALYTNRIADRYRAASERITGGIADASPLGDEPSPEELVGRLIFGDPQTCIEKLQRDVDMFRPTHMSFFAWFGGLEQSRVLRSMHRLAEEVLPAVKPATSAQAAAT